jgi:hypothetical protein
VIHPHVEPGVDHVHAEYDSDYGTIKTEWTSTTTGHLELHVTIPANTTATILLPASSSSVVNQDGKPLALTAKDGAVVRQIGSGSYIFSVDNE